MMILHLPRVSRNVTRRLLNAQTNVAPGNKGKKIKRPPLKRGTWNVRTMMTGISENLLDINDSRKTAVINNELKRLNIDIATLQETRLADSGTLKEKECTFFWQGKGRDERREHGVGFVVKNGLLGLIEPGSNGSERLLTLRLNTTEGPVTLVSVYAPTLTSARNKLFCLETSTPEWAQTTIRGLRA